METSLGPASKPWACRRCGGPSNCWRLARLYCPRNSCLAVVFYLPQMLSQLPGSSQSHQCEGSRLSVAHICRSLGRHVQGPADLHLGGLGLLFSLRQLDVRELHANAHCNEPGSRKANTNSAKMFIEHGRRDRAAELSFGPRHGLIRAGDLLVTIYQSHYESNNKEDNKSNITLHVKHWLGI